MNLRKLLPVGGLLTVLAAAPAQAQSFRALVFSKTVGFRHDSIAQGTALIRALGSLNDFAVDVTEDAGDFNAANLDRYAVVVWLNTTGNVLDDAQQAAFETWMRAGGGYVGVHAAADCEYAWPFYGEELLGAGAWFWNHPFIQPARVRVDYPVHPSTAQLPAEAVFPEEWYNFRANPRSVATVLLTLDESSYSGGQMGNDHPIAWCHENLGGRMWYTGLGHRPETYLSSDFRRHLLGGILWAARAPAPIPVSSPLGSALLGLGLAALGARALRRRAVRG